MLLLATVCLFGLFTSFHYHFAAWGIDPDTVETAVVWQNVRQHGLAFLRIWSFGPDNWLLTTIMPAAALYELVGAPPFLVIGLGWLTFVSIVGLTAAVAVILGGRIAALATAAFLLASGQEVLGQGGFLSHPVSHDMSMLWALVTLLCLARWLRRGASPWLALSGLSLAANCLSDPWALVGAALPAVVATLFLALRGQERRRAAAALAASVAAIVTAMTRAFGLLDFLPENPVQLADFSTFVANAAWLSRSVGVLFNPVPGLRTPLVPLTLAVCLILAAILTRSVWALARDAHGRPDTERFLLMAVGLSAVLPIGAFLLCRLPLSPYVGRFVPSLVVFAPLLAFAALGRCRPRLPRWLTLGTPLFFGLVMVAGAASNPSAWRTGWHGVDARGVPELAAFLAGHGLTYGYGSYWGTSANAVTWMSRGAVTIRPVWFDSRTGFITGQKGQTSALWYRPADAPAGQGRFFVAIWAYDESCANRDICVAGLQSQFGPATGTEHFRDLTILVWDHPLAVKADF